MCKTSNCAKRSNRSPSAHSAEMPSWMVSEIVNMVIDKWRGTLEQYKEDSLRNSSDGLYDAIFCEHNEHIAALAVGVEMILPPSHSALPARAVVRKALRIGLLASDWPVGELPVGLGMSMVPVLQPQNGTIDA